MKSVSISTKNFTNSDLKDRDMCISISTFNDIPNRIISQEKYYSEKEILLFIEKSLDYFKRKPNYRRPAKTEIIAHFFWRLSEYPDKPLRVSQEWLSTSKSIRKNANKAKSTKQVRRLLYDMANEAFLSIHSYGLRQVNEYELNELFFHPRVRQALRHLFPELDLIKVAKKKEKAAKKKEYSEIMLENINLQRQLNPSNVSNLKLITGGVFLPISEKEMSLYLSCQSYIRSYESETDDGRKMNEVEPDWLIAAGRPIRSDLERTGLEMDIKRGRGNHKREACELNFLSNPSLPIPVQSRSGSENDFQAKVLEVRSSPNTEPTQIKKVSAMKFYELKSILPTLYGQVRLSAFPEEIVYSIDNRVLNMKSRPEKPWNYFIAGCKKECEERGLAIDWTTMQKLSGKYCVPDIGPFIDPDFIPVSPVQARKQSGSKQGKEIDWDKAHANDKLWKQQDAERMIQIQAQVTEEFKRPDHAHWVSRGADLRKMMGLNEEGEFINKTATSQANALSVLINPVPVKIQSKPTYPPEPEYDALPDDYISNTDSLFCNDMAVGEPSPARLIEPLSDSTLEDLKAEQSKDPYYIWYNVANSYTLSNMLWFHQNTAHLYEDFPSITDILIELINSKPTPEVVKALDSAFELLHTSIRKKGKMHGNY